MGQEDTEHDYRLPDDRRLWTVDETAYYLGLVPQTLRNMLSQRRAPRSFRIGGLRKFRRADVDAWLELQASDAPQKRVRK